MKRTTAIFIMIITVALIGIPLLINYFGNIITIKTEASFGDWLGFWGSYLGGFVTLIGVYLAFKLEDRQRIKQSFHNAEKDVILIENISRAILIELDSDRERITMDWTTEKISRLNDYLTNKEIHPVIAKQTKEIKRILSLIRRNLDNIKFNEETLQKQKTLSKNKGTTNIAELKEELIWLQKKREQLKKKLKKQAKDLIVTISNHREAP